MNSNKIIHPSIKKSQEILQNLFDDGVMEWCSKNILLCKACKHEIKIGTNGDFCLSSHLKTKIHTSIMSQDDTDLPELLMKSEDIEDRFHVQREKYERNKILSRIPEPYQPWIEVKYSENAYKFYCTLCKKSTVSNQKADLKKHMLSDIHQEKFQQYLNDVKNGKAGDMTLENFVETYLETPKKKQREKEVPKPSPSTIPKAETSDKLQTQRITYPQRFHRSADISKQANKDSIRIYYQNVQSIDSDKKKRQFNYNIAREYDVIVFTETWLKEDSNLKIFDKDFDVYRCDRNSKNSYKEGYGGVLVAVSSKLYSDPVIIHGFDLLEYVCLKLFHRDHFVYIYSLYMPGELKKDISPQHIKAIEAIEYNKNDTLIVIGDFNMPEIKWIKTDNAAGFKAIKTNDMLRSLEKKQLYQLNNITNKCDNVLDLVFVNNTNATSLSAVRTENALMNVIDVHPPFEILIDSIRFPYDLSARIKEKAYLTRKRYIQKLEQLFETLNPNDWKNVDSLKLDICRMK